MTQTPARRVPTPTAPVGTVREGDAPTRRMSDARATSTRTRTIRMWQGVLAGLVALGTGVGYLVSADLDRSSWFWIGAIGVVAIWVAAMVVPWERVSNSVVLAIVLADIVLIGLVSLDPRLRLGNLWVIPLMWVALHFPRWAVALAIGTVALMLGITVIVLSDRQLVMFEAVRALVGIGALVFAALAVSAIALRRRALQRALRGEVKRREDAAAKAEEQRRVVVDMVNALDVAVARVAPSREVLAANEQFRTFLGPDAAAQELVARDGAPADDRLIDRVARGELLCGERIWVRGPDGKVHAFDVDTRALAAGLDTQASTLITARDVTEMIDLSEERTSLELIVSHEVRNPLTAILGHVDLLIERGDLSDAAARNATSIADAGERLLVLIEEVLGGDRRGPDAVRLSDTVDLRDLVRASVDAFAPKAASRDVSVEVDLAEPLEVSGDAGRLRQAIDNVVVNAIKYTEPGGDITVSGTIGADARGAGFAELIVADTGIGIGPDDAERVFEARFRTANAVSSGAPGTGLGLGMARSIARAHGGDLTLRSVLGDGTTVSLQLPLGPRRTAETDA